MVFCPPLIQADSNRHLCFTDEETEVHRGLGTRPGKQSCRENRYAPNPLLLSARWMGEPKEVGMGDGGLGRLMTWISDRQPAPPAAARERAQAGGARGPPKVTLVAQFL